MLHRSAKCQRLKGRLCPDNVVFRHIAVSNPNGQGLKRKICSDAGRQPAGSAFDLGEIRHAVQRVADIGQQGEAIRADGGILIIDHDMLEEGIDRPAQPGEFGHHGPEILVLERLFDIVAHLAERLVERDLLIRPGIDQRAIDDEMVICPVMTKPSGFPGNNWPTEQVKS